MKRRSRLLSLVLRHAPETVGITLDENGYANVDELIPAMDKALTLQPFDFEILSSIVETSDKQRFAFNEDKTMIRANQGHSIKVDLELEEQVPPEVLYHGTAEHNKKNIYKKGILKLKRNHVHLSRKPTTARDVGSRHGKAIILKINTAAMYNDGKKFYKSENNVWLTDKVETKYILYAMSYDSTKDNTNV